MNIAIIGGGRAATAILKQFDTMSMHRVVGVADLRDDSPGVKMAREKGIQTTKDMAELVSRPDVEVVLELTGSSEVQRKLRELCRDNQQLMAASGAKLMCDLVEAQNDLNGRLVMQISQEFSGATGTLQQINTTMDESAQRLEKLLLKANIISLNAKIEAARAGASGAAFSSVVGEIQSLVTQMQESLNAIGSASVEAQSSIGKLDTVRDRLTSTFQA